MYRHPVRKRYEPQQSNFDCLSSTLSENHKKIEKPSVRHQGHTYKTQEHQIIRTIFTTLHVAFLNPEMNAKNYSRYDLKEHNSSIKPCKVNDSSKSKSHSKDHFPNPPSKITHVSNEHLNHAKQKNPNPVHSPLTDIDKVIQKKMIRENDKDRHLQILKKRNQKIMTQLQDE